MRWLRAVAASEFVRSGIVCVLVVLMAAFSSGAISTAAYSSSSLTLRGVPPNTGLPIHQDEDDEDEDNDGVDVPTITLNVNSTLDEVDADPGDGNCASAANRCTLRAAIVEANARGGHHTITLSAGTYVLTINGANEENAATGDLDVYASTAILGASAGSTTIDASQIDRVFDLKGNSLDVRDLTVRNGAANRGGAFTNSGSGDLYLTRTNLLDNTATSGNGGAIFGFSDISITESLLEGNSARGNGGAIHSINRLTLLNSTISSNHANSDASSGGGWGRALYIKLRQRKQHNHNK